VQGKEESEKQDQPLTSMGSGEDERNLKQGGVGGMQYTNLKGNVRGNPTVTGIEKTRKSISLQNISTLI
jgi:hypothetical protein